MLLVTNLPQIRTRDCSQWLEWLQLSWSGRKKKAWLASCAGSRPWLLEAGEQALGLFGSLVWEQLCYLAAMVIYSVLRRSCIKQFLQIRLQKCKNLHEAMVILARVWAMLMNKWHKAVSQIWIALYLWHFLVLLASSTRQCFNIFLLNPTVCLTAALVLGTQMLSSLILFIHCCDYT